MMVGEGRPHEASGRQKEQASYCFPAREVMRSGRLPKAGPRVSIKGSAW